MTLEFTEAIFGTEKDFEATHLEACGGCLGSGARSSSSKKNCPTCGGLGQVMQTSQTPFGTFSQVPFISPWCTPRNICVRAKDVKRTVVCIFRKS